VTATVVALHGFLGAPDVWDAVASRVAAVRWVRPWLPGHGPVPAVYDGDFEAVVDAWLDPVVPAGAVLVGYSMGARLALSYAVRHPGRVRAAVLLSGTAGLSDAAARASRRAEDAARAESLRRDGVDAFVTAWEAMPMWASQAGLGETVRAAHRARRRGHTAEGLAWSLGALGTGAMPDYAGGGGGVADAVAGGRAGHEVCGRGGGPSGGGRGGDGDRGRGARPRARGARRGGRRGARGAVDLRGFCLGGSAPGDVRGARAPGACRVRASAHRLWFSAPLSGLEHEGVGPPRARRP
jgi:2-succinyl-6-hydroxy-2,4-cyclohexadiene-1-carboxylate synthase